MEKILANISYTLNNIDIAVQQFWVVAERYHLLAFSGDMGAGKTTFISHLCHYLKVEDTVSSPTFALVNEYRYPSATGGDNTIFHIDLYRVRNTAEAVNAGMEDCISQAQGERVYCFVEWPEKAPELLHKPHLWMSIESISPEERKMTVLLIS